MDDDVPVRLRDAARAVARAGLSDAFGHVSVRTSPHAALITPPVPLGDLTEHDLMIPLPLDSEGIPDGAPLEAWMHVAILTARPELGAVCRAQPPAVAAWAALQLPLPALTGQGAMLGRVAVRPDSRLVRDLESARAVATSLGAGAAVILRGNGALSVGPDAPSAVAAMWVLEARARLALDAVAAGPVHELPDDEQEWWRARASELLPRIYRYLAPTTPRYRTREDQR